MNRYTKYKVRQLIVVLVIILILIPAIPGLGAENYFNSDPAPDRKISFDNFYILCTYAGWNNLSWNHRSVLPSPMCVSAIPNDDHIIVSTTHLIVHSSHPKTPLYIFHHILRN